MKKILSRKNFIDKLPISSNEKSILERRINKFKRDPILFIEDSYRKRSAQIYKHVSKKEKAKEVYSVVVAVWNAELYLDDFFKSLVKQNIDFKKHIQIILVDDGSTDSSRSIIKKWQKRYPKNINYYYKENGGHASARNLGLGYAKTEWVTFIDPDDFISFDFFYQIESCVMEEKDLNLVVSNIIKYDDEYNIYSDSHPLKKRFNFKGNIKFIDIKDQGENILTSVCGVFFRKSLLENNRNFLRFNENLKVVFEDTNFVNKYIILNNRGKIGFVKRANYYHRNTAAHTIEKVWENISNFDIAISEGLLKLCILSQKELNYIPLSIQTAILYHVTWIVAKIVDNDAAIGFLGEEQKKRFLSLLDEVFYYIDKDCIIKYSYSKALFANKIGLLNVFKNISIEPDLQRAYIDSYNHNKKLFRVRYFSNSPYDLMSFRFDNEDIVASHIKVLRHNLLDRDFYFEYIVWVKIPEQKRILNLLINNHQATLYLGSRRFKSIGKEKIFNFFEDSGVITPLDKQTWFFIDSDLKADDNAEHLYRYIMNNTEMRKDQLLFGLNSTSHDWNRLETEGFNLVDMQGLEANIALKSSNKILSSNASDYIMHFDGKKSLLNKNFVFLQHGVIHNDLSQWLKAKDFDFFLTSTIDEYHSIAGDISNYFFTDREVKLTGQPRYDSLLEGNDTQKQILIMPTWRKGIVGKLVSGKTAEREFNPNFMQTEYAQKWQSFLNNNELKQLSSEYGYKIVYFPHANVQIYSHLFDIPEYIEVVTHDIGSIQPLFQKSALMITDYSSVAFEMAFLNKQVIYYQFDEEDFLSGIHTSKPNYFVYREDGFGPVVNEEHELISSLKKLLENGAEAIEPFASRIEKTFLYRDTENSKRVFDAILDIDREVEINVNVLNLFIEQSKRANAWQLLESRSNQLLDYALEKEEISLIELSCKNYLQALYYQNKYNDIIRFITNYRVELKSDVVSYWKAMVDINTGHEERALGYFTENTPVLVEEQLVILLFASRLQNPEIVEILQTKLSEQNLSQQDKSIILVCKNIFEDKIDIALEGINSILVEMSVVDKKLYKLELTACALNLLQNKLEEGYNYLLDYEKHTKDDHTCRLYFIELFYRQGYSKEIIQQYELAYDNVSFSPSHKVSLIYIRALFAERNWAKVEPLSKNYFENNFSSLDDEMLNYYLDMLIAFGNWLEAEKLFKNYECLKVERYYDSLLTSLRLGDLEDLEKRYTKPTRKDNYVYWKLMLEVSELNNNLELVEYCLKGIIAMYPEENHEGHWNKLSLLRANFRK